MQNKTVVAIHRPIDPPRARTIAPLAKKANIKKNKRKEKKKNKGAEEHELVLRTSNLAGSDVINKGTKGRATSNKRRREEIDLSKVSIL